MTRLTGSSHPSSGCLAKARIQTRLNRDWILDYRGAYHSIKSRAVTGTRYRGCDPAVVEGKLWSVSVHSSTSALIVYGPNRIPGPLEQSLYFKLMLMFPTR